MSVKGEQSHHKYKRISEAAEMWFYKKWKQKGPLNLELDTIVISKANNERM